MARLQPVELQFNIAIQATLDATKKILVATAKREHGVVLATTPQPNSFTRTVDGRRGAREEDARPTGVIVYDYQRLDLVAQYAMDVLFDKSPVGIPPDDKHPGLYRISHTMFLNNVAVTNLKDWKPGDIVSISNFVPYSRKIELGKMKMRVPGTDHVYEQAAQIVTRRYGNLANIGFTFQGIVGSAVVGGRAGNVSDARFPALIIKER